MNTTNEVLNFALQMQTELDKNSHKKGWYSLTPKECLKRMQEEMRELQESVKVKSSTESVRSECADVANFAMFLAHNYYSEGSE